MKLILCAQLCFTSLFGLAQFTQADSLRGGYTTSRDWWDLTHYDLSVAFDIKNQTISGENTITFKSKSVVTFNDQRTLQIDLQDPMILDSVVLLINSDRIRVKQSEITKKGAAYFIAYNQFSTKATQRFTVYFHGSPKIAKKAPWDGGIIWANDQNNQPWVTVACQGLGASVWWPTKDSQVDEPDSVSMHFTCPDNLVCVSNGIFTGKKLLPNQTATYSWKVNNPINNYCMIPYIGDYVNLHEHFAGEKGNLEMDYWVIRGNEEKAKIQFKDAPRTIEALEYWFGPYPFYEDGYKLVEAPHLGMEHQSAVAYGNGFKNGYMGSDLSGTGEGLKWDFIIVHESGHEWFGNNITSKDVADMWIHEGFTCYSETLFMDYWFGTENANRYCLGLRKNIKNDKPIIGQYGVQSEGSGDMYYKGANMLHTIRQLIQNDSIFRMMLREMNRTFYHQTVTTQEIESFMSSFLKMDLKPIFDQYLRSNRIPKLEIKDKKGKMKYRWANVGSDFEMPIIIENKLHICSKKWRKIEDFNTKSKAISKEQYITISIR